MNGRLYWGMNEVTAIKHWTKVCGGKHVVPFRIPKLYFIFNFLSAV